MDQESNIIRVFFGIPVEFKHIEYFNDLIRDANPKLDESVRWLQPGNHHITLFFIGDVATKEIDPMIDVVQKSLLGIKPFNVSVQKLYHFPKSGAKLVAAYIHNNRQIQKVYAKVEQALVDLDYPAEQRAYQPHVTLLRGKRNAPRFHIMPIDISDIELAVEEVILYKSLSKQGGSVYQPIHRFKLQIN